MIIQSVMKKSVNVMVCMVVFTFLLFSEGIARQVEVKPGEVNYKEPD